MRRSGLGFVAFLALAVSAAEASAAVISFEERAQGENVNIQYASQGVTFNNPLTFNYGAGFAHSPTKGVEQCFAAEFCQSPVEASFTVGQDNVRVWVGYNGTLSNPLPVELTAFDASNTSLGVAATSLPANASPTPIQTPLVLDPPGATITRIAVDTGPGGYTSGLAVDDVEFSTVGPPPPCTATNVPTVSIAQPSNNLTVQNNQFLLSGSVAANGAPITSAKVIAQSPTTRTGQAFPSLIQPSGGQFGPINYNGLLSPGVNDVVVTASNCAGTGTSALRRVNLTPIPPTTEFKLLGNIEITQGIQNAQNVVPLVAAGPATHKRTFARVYLGLQGGASSISQVTGRLTATRPDGTPPGGPLSVDAINTITVDAANTVDTARSSLSKSLNFELPREWLAAGKLHLQIDRLSIEGTQTTLPCIGCTNKFPSGTPALKTFHQVPPVRVWLVNVPYTATPGAAPTVPRQFDVDMLASWLRRAYPTAEVRNTNYSLPVQDGPPGFVDTTPNDGVDQNRDGFLCDDVHDELSEMVNSMQAQHANTRYYGIVDDNGGTLFMRGCAQIGGRFGAGPAGSGTFGWDNDGTYADWYGGHEIGHMYDRKHPGQCTESDDDNSFPYANGLIGDFDSDFQGFDPGNSTLGVPTQLYDWRDQWADVMTYCNNQWISDYTYRGILKNLCGREKTSCPNYAQLSSAPASRGSGAPAAAAGKGGDLRLALNGSLELPKNKFSLGSASVLRRLTLTKRPSKSAYSIALEDSRGRSLAKYPFEPKIVDDLPAGDREAGVDEVVPFDPETRRIVISKGGDELKSIAVSANAPEVRLTAPKPGKKLGGRTKVRWSADDTDGDRVTSTLLYSHDGKSWLPIAAGLKKRSYKVDLTQLPGGKKSRFQVVASDGVLTDTATSAGKGFKVPVKAPSVLISTPAAGAELVEGEAVQFGAIVEDQQDTRLKTRNVIWSSDLQGRLGKGTAITAALNPGTHKITVTATNSGGVSDEASVEVKVAAEPPVVQAELVP